ncbi:MAG TPA: site-specific DNA-methyltransferase [Chloroflexia bacterium]|nr:site-specific DNA-methyltransferase [Chloroflexia bacterium]
MDTDYLLCADAATALAALPDGVVDLLIADPPYNLGKDYGNNQDRQAWSDYQAFTRTWLTQAVRILKPTGSLYVFMGVRFIADLFQILEHELQLAFNGWITWHYTQGMGRTMGFSPRHEDLLYFTKSSRFTFNLDSIRVPQKYYRARNNMAGANPGDVWQFSHVHYCSAERASHPTQKPEALLERIIRASSNVDDLVLDPFVGSGTTCRVAKIWQRHWIGIDINPDYIAMSRQRVDQPGVDLDSVDPRRARIPHDLPGPREG